MTDQEKPKHKPSGYTVQDAEALWGRSVPLDASPGMSIKAGGARAGSASSKLVLRSRRIAEANSVTSESQKNDFELIKVLGQGGMGVVFSARQASLDREIAIKTIQPEAAKDAEAKKKFLAEAMVTGELDHPNIVPIHDLGGTADGMLFYAMKEVKGTSWDRVIEDKTESENLEVLMAVCDAVAFAHSKGVIHRDLKPENVMLGDYGEVMVMDWGLAASVGDAGGSAKAEHLTEESGRAGTPAYMAPEMARCDFDRIGPTSDIYLLGGMLYEIATGLRPHDADSVYACIYQAMENAIQPTTQKGELVDIALKAMATDPTARHASVKAFQQAVREYQDHRQSLKLSAVAGDRLNRLSATDAADIYRECTEIIAGYQQALELWSANARAVRGLRQAREVFVGIALDRGDLALAQSQVRAMATDCQQYKIGEKRLKGPNQLAKQVADASAEAKRKESIARLSRWTAVATAALLLIVATVAYVVTRSQRDRAVRAERSMRQARAEEARQREIAEEALRESELANYYSTIALADLKIEDSLIGQGEALLWGTPVRLRGWEWGRLMRLCHQDLLPLPPGSGKVCAAFSPDGMQILTGGQDAAARIWDSRTGDELMILVGHSERVMSVAFSPNGRHAVTGSADRTAKIWDVGTAREALALCGHTASVRCVAFSPDGSIVVTACSGRESMTKLWDTATGRELKSLKGGRLTCGAAFSPDGKLLATVAPHGVKIWDVGTGRELRDLSLRCQCFCVAFSPDGKRVAAGTGARANNVSILDPESGRELLALKGHPHLVVSVAFSPDGRRLLTGSTDQTARIWDLADGRELSILRGHSGRVGSVAFSPNSKRALTAGSPGAKVWEVERVGEVLGSEGGVWATVACSPGGHRVAVAKGETPKIYDVDTGLELHVLKGHVSSVRCLAFSPDGGRLVTGGCPRTRIHRGRKIRIGEDTAKIWDTHTGCELNTLRGHSSGVACVAFSPDGTRIATGSADKTVKIWDARTGRGLLTFKGHSDSVRCLAFSPEGKRLLTGSTDQSPRIWDAAEGRELRTLTDHWHNVYSVDFSPDGKRCVVASTTRLAVYDTDTGLRLRLLKGHPRVVYSARFSPDGRRILTGGDDKTAKIWDAETGRELLTLNGHSRSVMSVAFSSDGHLVATGSLDGTVRIWQASSWTLSLEELERQKLERYKQWLGDRR